MPANDVTVIDAVEPEFRIRSLIANVLPEIAMSPPRLTVIVEPPLLLVSEKSVPWAVKLPLTTTLCEVSQQPTLKLSESPLVKVIDPSSVTV